MGWTSQVVVANQVIIEGSADGLFIYSGDPALGNLIGSWAAVAGTDPYGNAYPAGINASQGQLLGVLLTSPTIVSATITSSLLNAPSITQAMISAGTMTQTAITFNSTGGSLLCYATTTTTTTFSSAGTAQWTAPAGVTSAKVEVWGSGAGGAGGGGGGGGGGEYAQEPAYTVVAGNTYNIVVGTGGTGGTGGAQGDGGAGGNGNQSSFDGQGVVAFGGTPATLTNVGEGGSGSTNTINEAGGNGGSASSTGGAGGGGSGGSTGAGGAGHNSSSSTGGAAGSAGTGGGAAGGAGGNNGAGGSNASAPGGGGGGAGAQTGSTGQISFVNSSTYSYYGSQASDGANTQRNTNGSCYQGAYSGGLDVDGDQFSFAYFGSLASSLSGLSITGVTLNLTNQHSWYNSGMYVILGYSTRTTYGTSVVPGADEAMNQTSFFISEGANLIQSLPLSFATAFQSGGAVSIMFGTSASSGNGAGDLYNYGYFDGGVAFTLTFTYGVSAGNPGGTGANGEVKVTYTNASTLECAVSPVSGSDSSSNAYGAGFTGPIAAIQPGSSPTAVETWHNMSPYFGTDIEAGSTTPQFKAMPDGTIRLRGSVELTANRTATETVAALPSGYTASAQQFFVCLNSLSGSSGTTTASIGINSGSGTIYLNVSGSTGNVVYLDGVVIT